METKQEHYESMMQAIARYAPSADLEVIQRAYAYADEKHKNQLRKSGEPYIIHPLAVAEIVAEIGLDTDAIVAALLHDCTKEWTAAEQLAFCDSQGIGLDAQEKACVKVLHGRTAAVLAERTFGLPAAVCDAIRRHSTLCERYAPLDAGEALFDALTRAMGTRKEDAQCAT